MTAIDLGQGARLTATYGDYERRIARCGEVDRHTYLSDADVRAGCIDRQVSFPKMHNPMRIGNLASARRADVGSGGVIRLPHLGVTIEFWIGADDRWHIPSTAITARHDLVGDAPIVRTSVRVPGGDAVLTTYGVRQGRNDVLVTELANQTSVPFAIAVVVRTEGQPLSLTGSALSIGNRDSGRDRGMGHPLVYLPRVPQLVLTRGPRDDLLDQLRAGLAHDPRELSSAFETIAMLLPVTHRTTVRIGTVLEPATLAAPPVLSALAGPDDVARGWDVQRGAALSISVPDPALVSRYRRLLGACLLDISTPSAGAFVIDAVLARTAASVGLGHFARTRTEALEAHQTRRGVFADDVATTALCLDALIATDRSDFAAKIAAGLEYVARHRARAGEWAAVLARAATWFAGHGEVGAAASARRAWIAAGSPWPMPSWPREPVPAQSFGPEFVPTGPAGLAADIAAVLAVVARDTPDGAIDLLAGFDDGWCGAPVDVRRWPVSGGELSFAVRWHGERAALLWENTGSPVDLTCRSLDPAWKSSQAKGEALLSAVLLRPS